MNALKRLSWNSTGDQQQPHLVPPSGRSPQPGTHTPLSYAISPRSAPSSPSYPFPIVPAPPVFKPQVERPTLHKSLAALSGLLVALDEYRDLSAASAKAQKKVAKACKEVAATFGDKVEPGARSEVILAALMASSAMFEGLAEVDARHAKTVQREYEGVNELAGRFFKKVAKEEKSLDEAIATLDAKVQKATGTYEKSRPRAKPSMADAQAAAASHDRYISSLSNLSSSIAGLKLSHADISGEKRDKAVKEVGRVLCGLAESAWKNRVEGTRKGGEKAGEVVARGVWCESGMPSEMSPGLAGEDQRRAISDGSQAPLTSQPPQTPFSPQQQRRGSSSQHSTLRGPRPQPESRQSYADSQPPPPLDPSLFATSPSLPSNTYLVQLPALQPNPTQNPPPAPQSQSLEAPPDPQQYSSSPRAMSVARLPSTESFASSRQVDSSQQDLRKPRPQSSAASGVPEATPMNASSSGGTIHSLSSSSDRDRDDANASLQRIVAPRGFVLDEDTLSPTTMVDCGSEGTATSGGSLGTTMRAREDQGLKRPTPGYGALPMPPPTSEPERGLERMESSASERNFVARMREKYAEEKEKRQDEEERSRVQERSMPSTLPRSNSRVSNLAKRYSSPPTSTFEPHTTYASSPASARPPPVHSHSQSMQPLSGGRPYEASTIALNEFGQRSAPEHWSRSTGGSSTYGAPPPPGSRPLPQPTSSYTRQSLPSDEPHSSICACESCTHNNYLSGAAGTTQEEEGRLQKEFRSVGRQAGDKRLSMPAVFGGRR